ncbi:3-hydroxyacyl-CoA dehydrogenase NAD-binding domain-containing protein [Pseudohalocynthiibacter sp. F2068]|jgi:3-hydroxyacyl-CoA dehydrogenase|uniref:3-hydroxyacyl-CoA dehydrogenase NAD-binding domain-containing protein n=1 Tax=Pseudohalocynthiibacter sp. F2068 TaxID=2926418 RepID=UPI001FF5890E|nr:3-hydroxyacyl-CoA dehydrogenase NAD-binding domain-containing protein [Pseudohalocynthiibacter sp. F2068]MCK0104192.1 3-hydroxyacyl-CoA dehydrogenase NAD-binding domain-containing protein [Pseudohalocynthiibacter sp. F2068]
MISIERTGDVAFVELNAPPVNALGQKMRQALSSAIHELEADGQIAVVVLCSALPLFCGGADIVEFRTGKVWDKPDLPDLCLAIEACRKPVVAAIGGAAMGGALEIALACDYRVATPDAVMGLPEIKLGLLPGAGGTQRLPRIAGLEVATKMILSGDPVKGEYALSCGLVDALFENDQDFRAHVLGFATRVSHKGDPKRSCADMTVTHPDPKGFLAGFRDQKAPKSKNLVAPERCLVSIEAACELPLAEGLVQEKAGFAELLDTPQSRAGRHLFFAERECTKAPGVTRADRPRSISSVAVIGAGTMGRGIAIAFLQAGYPVTLLETTQGALELGLEKVREHFQRAAQKGRLSADRAEAIAANATGTLSYGDLAKADLIIEAAFESMTVKRQIFEALDRHAKPGAMLASNTSTLDLDEIAAVTSRPEDVIGLHFFSPANVMRLLEVVRGAKTAPDVIATAITVAKKIRKLPVTVGVCYGFVGNRMLEPYFREGSRMLLEGATPKRVDDVLENFGMAMGIHAMADLAGVDVGARVRQERRSEIAHDPTYQAVQDKLFELGRLGQKTGRGSYIYEGRTRVEDTEIVQISTKLAERHGVTRRQIGDQEVLERCLYPLINEGFLILEEEIAVRPGDCDLIWVNGYGFPNWRGGPMHFADEIGLGHVLERMHHYRQSLGAYGEMWFTPASLLKELGSKGMTLAGHFNAKKEKP